MGPFVNQGSNNFVQNTLPAGAQPRANTIHRLIGQNQPLMKVKGGKKKPGAGRKSYHGNNAAVSVKTEVRGTGTNINDMKQLYAS